MSARPTREQIESATPEELDLWIAEHVFRWREIPGPTSDYDGPCEHGPVLIPNDTTDREAYERMPFRGKIARGYFANGRWTRPHPADQTGFADEAFGISSKIDTWYIVRTIEDRRAGMYKAILEECGGQEYVGRDITIPLAICRAVLFHLIGPPENET